MVMTAAAARRRVRTDQTEVPATGLTFYQALYGRRTAWNFKAAPVPRATVQRLLNAAVCAPDHRLTEPWRFFIVLKIGHSLEAGETGADALGVWASRPPSRNGNAGRTCGRDAHTPR